MPVKSRRTLLLTLAAFALALFACTLFLGDIGVYNDDYFCNQRDPVTGNIHDLVMTRPWHVWRPLTRVVLTPLITTLWPHPWIVHAIDALLHGAIVALVYTLLRRFGTRAALAAPVALAFMVYPVHFEAVLWMAITCTLLSIILMLSIWHLYLTWLARADKWPVFTRFLSLIALGVLAYCSAAFNEQPVGALAALPLAPLVVGFSQAPTRRRRIIRSALPVLAVTIALGIYLRGFFHHIPEIVRSQSEIHSVGALPQHLRELVTKIPEELVLYQFASGAFREGWHAVAANPTTAVLTLGLLLLLGIAWTLSVATTPASADAPADRRNLFLIALGACWVVSSWLPVAASHSFTSPRLHYVPNIGLATIAAALLSLVATRLDRVRPSLRRAFIILSRAVLCSSIAAAILIWIGIQANYQRRALADTAEMDSISRAFGTSIPPDTCLIPVHIRGLTAQSGSPRFDQFFQHAWFWELASGWRTQWALHRNDLYSVLTGTGVGDAGLWLDDNDPARRGLFHARLSLPVPPDFAAALPKSHDHPACRRIPWDRVLLFDVVAPGHIEFYTKLRLHIPNVPAIEIIPTAISIAPLGATLPEKTLDILPAPPAVHAHKLPLISDSSPDTSSAPRPQ